MIGKSTVASALGFEEAVGITAVIHSRAKGTGDLDQELVEK